MNCPHCEIEMDSELIDWPMRDYYCDECNHHEQHCDDDPPFAAPANFKSKISWRISKDRPVLEEREE